MRLVWMIFILIGFILFASSSFILFEPSADPTGFFVYTPSIAVINPDNAQPVGSIIEISFITKGTNNLTVEAVKGSAELLELRCDAKIIAEGSSAAISYEGYKCEKGSSVAVKILSKETEIEFRFGKDVQQARNLAPLEKAEKKSCGCSS